MGTLDDFQQSIASVGDGIEFRGLTTWPRALTPDNKRKRSPFGKATWDGTVRVLKHELKMVRAHNARLQLALPDDMVRRDGIPRAHARPQHPGVILSFDHPKIGRLVYVCDTFREWQSNVRAIGLTLRDLRRAERYGALRAGEQYGGSRLLTAGGTTTTMTTQMAAEYIAKWAVEPSEMRIYASELIRDPSLVDAACRDISKYLHPDAGDQTTQRARADQFDLLVKARDTLRAHHGLGRT